MDDSRLTNINQLKPLLKGAESLDLSLRAAGIKDKYGFINQTIDRLEYSRLNTEDKKIVRRYLKKLTGYRRARFFRLIRRATRGRLELHPYHRLSPHQIYTSTDVKLFRPSKVGPWEANPKIFWTGQVLTALQ